MVSAQAADLSVSSVKDAVPAVPDGPITWMGVTLYGTIDVGYAYAGNGAYPSGSLYEGVGGTIFGSAYNHQQVSTLNNNALSVSNVGLKMEEQIGYGFLAIGKIQTEFNPISGELADACASLLRNSGRSLFNMDNNGDGSRCGQAFQPAVPDQFTYNRAILLLDPCLIVLVIGAAAGKYDLLLAAISQ